MSFEQLAKNRFSVRSFLDRPVEKEKLDLILQAGQVAPTACNNQPQRVYVLQGEDTLKKLEKCTPCRFGAPLALLTCYAADECWKRAFDGKCSGDVDASIVTTQMMLQAADLGIGSTWVMFFDPEAVRAEFSLPEGVEPVSILVMGYPAPDAKPSALHSAKKPLGETVIRLDS